MRAITFPEVNVKIAEHQPDFETLPAYYNNKEGSVTFCFTLDKEELDEVIRTGNIYFKQLTGGYAMQPIALSTLKSNLIPDIMNQNDNIRKVEDTDALQKSQGSPLEKEEEDELNTTPKKLCEEVKENKQSDNLSD